MPLFRHPSNMYDTFADFLHLSCRRLLCRNDLSNTMYTDRLINYSFNLFILYEPPVCTLTTVTIWLAKTRSLNLIMLHASEICSKTLAA